MHKEPRLSEAKRRLLELQMRGEDHPSAAPDGSEFKRHPRETPPPLALAQEQVWLLDQSAGNLAPLHNESITIHRYGPCDPALLEKSLTEIIRRHEIWRTTFEIVAGKPVQVIHAPAPFPLPLADLRTLPQEDREKKAQELANEDARKPFDLKQGPLLRARLVTLDEAQHRLYVTAHQSIVDGITVFDIFPSELTTLYEGLATGKLSTLPELDTQYADFASWQRGSLRGTKIESQLAYWQKHLAGELPILQWPNNGVRPPEQTFRGAMHAFALPPELTRSVKDLGRREGATLFMILLSALVSLLHHYTGQDDIIVGTLAPSGRKHTEFQRSIGYFLNLVALRVNLAGNPPFRELLRQVREVTLGAISNDDVPLAKIAETLQVKLDPSRHPFFTVALSVAPDVPQLPPGWSMTYMDVESGGARWDLYLELSDRAEGLLGRAQYNPDLFTPETLTQTIDDLRMVLQEIAASRRS